MLYIHKITSDPTVDFAAEELKKYLRMMMPECGDVKIRYFPEAEDGFRLGLMQDFGLDVSDAENTELDDILYMDCDTEGGIIAGDNPRSVLLAVYEYLRQNGCRWLYPGIDGEFIPMQDIVPVKYRHKPSCRVRGHATEGADFQQDMLAVIDFLPKLGMNAFMFEFRIPGYYHAYYEHYQNTENRRKEPVNARTLLGWKRQVETEIAKRGIQYHDMGHGFTTDPFGINSMWRPTDGDYEELTKHENMQYMAMMGGKRRFYRDRPIYTNFCMSNARARSMVADYIVDYARNHSYTDYLHVWLSDGSNNHCECEACQKKTPSDWYIMLMNEVDEKLTEAGLNTRIVFIAYVDTTFAPETEVIRNQDRFTLLIAPIFRHYSENLNNIEKKPLKTYKRNQNNFPRELGEYMDHLAEWKKGWRGNTISFEYHFWRFNCYDLSGLVMAQRIYDDVQYYRKNGVDGMLEDGSQRVYFPNGLAFYTMARAQYDASLTMEEIIEDYYSHVYGEDWRLFRDYLAKLNDALPYTYFIRDLASKRKNVYYDPAQAEKIETIREITKEGRALVEAHLSKEYRVRTVSLRLLEDHADFCDRIADWMAARARGEEEKAAQLFDIARVEFGKVERDIEFYYDHWLYFGEYKAAQSLKSPSKEDIFIVENN